MCLNSDEWLLTVPVTIPSLRTLRGNWGAYCISIPHWRTVQPAPLLMCWSATPITPSQHSQLLFLLGIMETEVQYFWNTVGWSNVELEEIISGSGFIATSNFWIGEMPLPVYVCVFESRGVSSYSNYQMILVLFSFCVAGLIRRNRIIWSVNVQNLQLMFAVVLWEGSWYSENALPV